MKWCFWLLILLGLQSCERSRTVQNSSPPKDSYRIISYNVENLFDTYDEPYKMDDDFTPEGQNHWTSNRYNKKIIDIGKVLVNASNNEVPAVIGLMEIENEYVLEDLISKSPLSKFTYARIHEDSPDERGIDVALLYDTEQFLYLDYEIGRIDFPEDLEDKTRDILLVKGLLGRKDTIYFIVNHWPSRRGGEQVSEPKRSFVAQFLKERISMIQEKEPNAQIILMGDFNDTPSNKSIQEDLGAKSWTEQSPFINLMTEKEKEGKGSYKYQNQWNMIDQFIVSKNLTDQSKSLFVTPESATIFVTDFLVEDDPIYPGQRLFRTYRGPNYIGGYSDHFPIVLDIYRK